MKHKGLKKPFLIYITCTIIITMLSGCALKVLMHAPLRSFLPQDLLLTKDDISSEWTLPYGPKQVSDNTKPLSSMEIALLKSLPLETGDQTKWDLLESVYQFQSVEGAKEDYAVTTTFPGTTDIPEWNFVSHLADEQKFSCYTYSNISYPVCRWVARYKEFEIEVVSWMDPDRMNLQEMQSLVIKIDEKVSKNFEPDP